MEKENTAQPAAKAIGEATPEQIAAWKKQHGDVYEVSAIHPDTEQEHKGYLRRPTRPELSYATKVGQSNPLGFNEAIVKSCWLGGSEEIRTNDALFMGVSGQLDVLIEVAQASIKKL